MLLVGLHNPAHFGISKRKMPGSGGFVLQAIAKIVADHFADEGIGEIAEGADKVRQKSFSMTA